MTTTYKICFWDSETNSQKERDMNAYEIAELEARKAQSLLPEVPHIIEMKKARKALIKIGKLSKVLAILAQMPGIDGECARSDFEFSSTIERNNPLVIYVTPLLGMTSADMDNLFIEANKL